MDSVERLENAKLWLKNYEGKKKNLAKNYRNRYCLGWARAFEELKVLGIDIDENFIKEKIEYLKTLPNYKESKNQPDQDDDFDDTLFDEDNNFSFIIGHTSNGMPFGTER